MVAVVVASRVPTPFRVAIVAIPLTITPGAPTLPLTSNLCAGIALPIPTFGYTKLIVLVAPVPTLRLVPSPKAA